MTINHNSEIESTQSHLFATEVGETVPQVTVRSTLVALLKTMRPQQWHKNIFVFAGLVFDGKLLQWDLLLLVTLVALCFCLLSSAVYIINDLADLEKDRLHPKKRLRPLPSGQLPPVIAGWAGIGLALLALTTTAWFSPLAGMVALVYLAQNVAYSFWLKDVVLIDVMLIALGFLLRVVVGVLTVQVTNFSPWLYICVTLGALFLGFGKRRHELMLLEGVAATHRLSLQGYNLPLLDQIIGLLTTSTLITYTFYTFEARTALVTDGRMLLTVPFLLYFILRYLYLVHVRKLGGAPEELVLKDKPLLINSLLWIGTVIGLLYW